MIISRESTAYHLTASGWHSGDRQRRFGLMLCKPAPENQVLSLVFRKVTDENGHQWEFFQEVWRSTNHALVIGLLARFGRAPSKL